MHRLFVLCELLVTGVKVLSLQAAEPAGCSCSPNWIHKN
jgi:hypothetical protein